MIRVIIRTIAAAFLILAVGAATVPIGHAMTSAVARPTLSPQMWDKLASLPSYHVESSLKITGSITQSVSLHWTEDSHGQDYHLTVSSSAANNAGGEIYVVKGHYYIGTSGHFIDAGSMGKQMAAPIKALTLDYWSTLAQNSRDVRYVGRVMTNGRSADRFKVLYALMAPGMATGSTISGSQSLSYTSTVDVDVKTHAPLRVTGAFQGTDGQGHAISLASTINVTRIGQVHPITAPAVLSVPGL